MQGVQENTSNSGRHVVSKERRTMKDQFSIVKLVNHIIAQVLIEENVRDATGIAFIKAENALFVKTLNALPVSLVYRCSIRFV